MNDLLPMLAGILLRATWLMGGALLLIGFLQRRRPLVASSLVTSTVAGLLMLPLVAAGLPGLAIPLWKPTHERAKGAVLAAGSSQEDVREASVTSSEPDPGNPHDPVRSSALQKPAGSQDVDEGGPFGRFERGAAEMAWRRQDGRQSTQAPQESSASGRGLLVQWPAMLTAVYLLGVLALAVRLLAGLWLVHRLRQSATVVNGEWENRLDAWRLRCGTARPVELRASDVVTVPMTFGWRKPAILLPKSMLHSLAPHQDAVLLHELAHIRRQDFVGLLLLQLAQVIYWCHPLTWILGPIGRYLRERACDDVCIHWMGEGDVYRNALLAIARQTICRPRLSLGLAMAHPSRLARRLAQIDRSTGNDDCVARRAVRIAAFGGMMTVAMLAALVHFVPRQAIAQPNGLKGKPAQESREAAAAEPGLLRLDAQNISRYERARAADENGGHEPESLVAILGTSKLNHRSGAVAWSPDGRMLGSVGYDGCLRLWDPDTGEQLKRFKSDPLWLNGGPGLISLAFEPAGKQVAAGLETNALRIWDIATGTQTALLKDDEPVLNIAWHPTQPLLATGGEATARLWDLSTGKVVRSLDPQDKSFQRKQSFGIVHVAFSPDGQHIIVGHPDGSVRFWNVATGDVTRTIKAHEGALQAIAIDVGRDRLATGGQEGKLRLWRLSTGEAVGDFELRPESIQGLAFHPRQEVIYSSAPDGMIRKWNIRTGEMALEIRANRFGGAWNLAFHPSRDIIASAGFAVGIWNATTGKPHLDIAAHLGGIQGLRFTPDGSRLITAGNDTTVRVWDAINRTPLATYEFDNMPAAGIDVTPDGKTLVTISRYRGSVDIRNLDDGMVLNSFKTDGEMNESVSVSLNGKWLAATSYGRREQGVLTLWDLSKNALHGRIQTHRGRLHFNRDGTQLLVVGTETHFGNYRERKARLSVWDTEKLEKTLSLDDVQGLASVERSALSPDGATLAVAGTSYDMNEERRQRLIFWDWTKNATRLVVDMQGHQPGDMAYSADGRSLVTTSAREGDARIWDPRDGALRETFHLRERAHSWVLPVAFAPDGRHFAVAMGNGTIDLIRTKPAPENVPIMVSVPPADKEPEPDQWKALLGKPAPALQAQGWLFGESAGLVDFRGEWVVLYFWNNAGSDRDMAAWMEVHQRFGARGLTVIVVKPPHAESIEKEQVYFERVSRESWEGRPLPFRVLVDKREPNVIPGTRIKTGGATHSAYRVMQARRGYLTNAVALLIGPDGMIEQQINTGPARHTIRELEARTGLSPETPEWERDWLQECALSDGQVLRHLPPPYSPARENYRFFNNHGRRDATMTFEYRQTPQQRWTTGGEVTLEWVLNFVAGFKSYELVDSGKFMQRPIAGDWCWRAGISREELLRALEQIAQNELGWKLHFERSTIKQPVVVATGKWQQTALAGLENQKGIFLSVDDLPDAVNGGGGSGSLDEMFAHLGDRIHFRFINEVTDPPKDRLTWQDRMASHIQDIRDQSAEGKEKFTRLLNNLARQTGLTLKTEVREVIAWRIVAE